MVSTSSFEHFWTYHFKYIPPIIRFVKTKGHFNAVFVIDTEANAETIIKNTTRKLQAASVRFLIGIVVRIVDLGVRRLLYKPTNAPAVATVAVAKTGTVAEAGAVADIGAVAEARAIAIS